MHVQFAHPGHHGQKCHGQGGRAYWADNQNNPEREQKPEPKTGYLKGPHFRENIGHGIPGRSHVDPGQNQGVKKQKKNIQEQ